MRDGAKPPSLVLVVCLNVSLRDLTNLLRTKIFYRLVLTHVSVLEYHGCYGNPGKPFGNKMNVYYLMFMTKVIS